MIGFRIPGPIIPVSAEGAGFVTAMERATAIVACLCLFSAISAADDAPPAPESTTDTTSKPKSQGGDGVDLSDFLDRAYGFIPILVPITEPAVGYGAFGGLVFINRPLGGPQAGLERPNITAVGGLATENGTWGVMAGDVRHWHDNRVQTVAGAIYASVNLDFFGIGKDSALNDHPLRYNLEPLAGGVRGRYRLGDSRLWIGLSYVLMDANISFDDEGRAAALLGPPSESRVGGLTPSLAHDSRDNIFTPNRGSYFEGTAGLFDEAFGGDSTFQRVGLMYIVYMPLRPRLIFGVKGSTTFSFGDVPFYLRPFITLRGAPILRYQGAEVADAETEVRWQFWKRWSVVGFVGGGAAWNNLEHFDNLVSVLTGGTGFRYELARKYGLHAGVDVAWGPEGYAFYFQFGSAWARP